MNTQVLVRIKKKKKKKKKKNIYALSIDFHLFIHSDVPELEQEVEAVASYFQGNGSRDTSRVLLI